MSDFVENLGLVLEMNRIKTVKEAAGKIGLSRTTLSRLRSGARAPGKVHLESVARYVGYISAPDLLKPHEEFKSLLLGKSVGRPESPLFKLALLARSLPDCAKAVSSYKGQYILYSPSVRENTIIGSLMEIGEVTPQGISTRIINPYNGHDGSYLAFEYEGFCMPVSDYLYIFMEQQNSNYEISTIIFHAAPIGPAQILEGIWSGIGVRANRKFVSSSPCIAVRNRELIRDWRGGLGHKIGYLQKGKCPRIVQMNLTNESLVVRA